jgi:hypothetical protein
MTGNVTILFNAQQFVMEQQGTEKARAAAMAARSQAKEPSSAVHGVAATEKRVLGCSCILAPLVGSTPQTQQTALFIR